MNPQAQPSAWGQLEIELSFFPLMWILYFITPNLVIDGQPSRPRWGKHIFSLPVGQHHVRCSYPYLFRGDTSPAELVVDIQPNTTTSIRYRPAWLVILDGSLRVVGQRPALPAPPQHQLR